MTEQSEVYRTMNGVIKSSFHLLKIIIIFLFFNLKTNIASKADQFSILSNYDDASTWLMKKTNPIFIYDQQQKKFNITLNNVEVICCNDCDNRNKKDVIGTFINPLFLNPSTIPNEHFEPNGQAPICIIYKTKIDKKTNSQKKTNQKTMKNTKK